MKKLFGFTLLAIAVSMSFQSCRDDNLVNGGGSSRLDDGKCYMSLRFDVKQSHDSDPSTRTFQPTEPDEEFERTVADFRIFLVKKDDPTAAVVELKDIPMRDAVTTQPFEINKAYTHGYLLYVVANAAGNVNLDLSSGEAFRGTYKPGTKETCENIWRPGHFLMVNVNNEASDFADYKHVNSNGGEDFDFEYTDSTPNGGVPVEIDDNTEYTYDNPYIVKVNLERLAAKIVVDCSGENFDFSSTTYSHKFSDVHVESVALINGANCYNLVQQWQIACYQGKYYFADHWNRKYYSPNILPDGAPFGYPYLWAVTPGGDIASVPSQIYYNQVANFTDFENRKLQDGAEQLFMSLDANKKATMYCLENASPLYLDFIGSFTKGVNAVENSSLWVRALQTGMRNRATGVLFRVRAKVKGDSHNTDGLTPDPDTGKWDTRAVADDDYPTFYCYQNTVSAYLQELLNLYPTLATKGITTASSAQELRAAGVRVYEDGYMYYMHWITDKNYKYFWNYSGHNYDEAYPFHYLAVLRNTRYEVNVTGVSELGMDLPGREFQYSRYSGTKVVEGTNYMLYPVYLEDDSMYGYMNDDVLNGLKNKAI